MKLRHGQLWQRLGLAIVSGILVTSLAPSTIAAPLDGQEMGGDAQSTDLNLSRSDSGVADPADSQDRAASDGTDASESAESAESADAATASSQEESADVHTYVYPGTSGPTRVHVISTQGSDAILLESKGVFGMIDGGEGQGAPDGSDPRYPLREGTTPASKGDTQRILDYMSSQGVTSSNLAFYLGTHPHSDHIDNADDIIYRFHPQVIFSPEYSDAWISNPNALWDNQWVYDRMIAAASWAQRSYGAQLVQHVRNYDTHVQLGDMDVQLIPFDPQESYQRHPIRDANLLGWGSVVSAYGHRAFLAADLEIEGDLEDRIAAVVGHVDMLKAGHHGLATSNSESFMATLSPSMIIQTNPEWVTPDRLTTSVTVSGTASWAPTADLWDRARIPAVVGTFSESGISYNDLSAASWGHEYYQGVTPRAWWFQGAPPVDVRLVEGLVRHLVLLYGSPLLCDEPVGERSWHLVLDGFHRCYGGRVDLRRKLQILPRRQWEPDRTGVAERRWELALFRRRSCVHRVARRPGDLVPLGRVNRRDAHGLAEGRRTLVLHAFLWRCGHGVAEY